MTLVEAMDLLGRLCLLSTENKESFVENMDMARTAVLAISAASTDRVVLILSDGVPLFLVDAICYRSERAALGVSPYRQHCDWEAERVGTESDIDHGYERRYD